MNKLALAALLLLSTLAASCQDAKHGDAMQAAADTKEICPDGTDPALATWNKAKADDLRAEQSKGVVMIWASGMSPTPNYKVAFHKSNLLIFPPEFSLVHKAPSGIQTQVMTPFSVCVQFKAAEPIKAVTVHDAAGKHSVTVTQK